MSIKYLKGIEVLKALEDGKYIQKENWAKCDYIYLQDEVVRGEDGDTYPIEIDELYFEKTWVVVGCEFKDAIEHIYNNKKVKDIKADKVYNLSTTKKCLVDSFGSQYDIPKTFQRWKEDGVLICL